MLSLNVNISYTTNYQDNIHITGYEHGYGNGLKPTKCAGLVRSTANCRFESQDPL